jgi:GAF domain-containing protein
VDISNLKPESPRVSAAEPSTRPTEALQSTIDILSESQDLDEFVPKVLQIVAEAFGAENCSVFKNYPSGEVRLQYWYTSGRTLPPDELMRLDPENFGTIRLLAEGFTVPDTYLAVPASRAIGAFVLDHAAGTAVPEFDRFCLSNNWHLELNVGVAARGVRVFSLCIYRKRSHPFSAQEIRLAEALAKQLGLAFQINRLADETREVAVAKEQAAAAQQLAAELSRADALLRAVVDASRNLVENADFGASLKAAAAALGEQTGVDRVYVFRRIANACLWVLAGEWHLHGLLPYAEIIAAGMKDADFPEVVSELLAGQAYRSVHADRSGANAELNEETQSQSDLIVPIVVNGTVWGCVGFDDNKASREWSDAEVRVLEGAAAAISAAVIRHDSEEKLREAVAREREQAAKEQAAMAEELNRAIQRSIDSMTAARETRAAILELLRTISEVLSPFGLFDIALVELNEARQTVRASILIRDGKLEDLAGSALDHDWPVDEPPMSIPWARVQAEDFIWGLTSDPEVLLPEVRDYHETAGPISVAYVPMRRGKKTTGWIALSMRAEQPFTKHQIEFVRTLAGQVSLAVELERVAEVERQHAMEMEREAQARRVNDFLVKTIGSISSGADLANAVEAVMVELAHTLEAAHVQLFRHDPATRTIRLSFSYLEGQLRWGMSGDELPLFAKPFPDDITPAWEIMCAQRKFTTPELSPVSAETFAWPGGLEYARRFELSDLGHIVLFVGDTPVGSIGVAFRNGKRLKPADTPFIEAAAQQAAIVIRMLDLGEEAKQAALAREREEAAERRAIALARSGKALQATIEALSQAMDLDQIVPRVLTIVAETFGSKACSLFENDSSGRTRLLYWNVEGRTYTPAELLQLDPEKFGLVRTLAEGFEVPDSYLGIPSNAVGAVVLDHVLGTSRPEFDAFALAAGWELELNVGVGGGGIRASTLAIYREGSRPFASDEIALAESLATQLGLAVEFARLAEAAQQTAIAREREQTAAVREAEARRISDFLNATLGSMSEGLDLRQTVESILTGFAGEVGAAHVFLFRHDAATRSLRLELSCIEGTIRRGLSGVELPLWAAPFPADITPAWQIMAITYLAHTVLVAYWECRRPRFTSRDTFSGALVHGPLSRSAR